VPSPRANDSVSYLVHHPGEVALRTLQHLEIVGLAIAIAFAIALPLGVLAARNAAVRGPLLAVLNTIYTLPSLAVFAFLVTYFGLGFVTTEIALVAYAQLVLVRNVSLGLLGVPAATREAALGLGMTPLQSLVRVEFPFALPAGKIDAGGLGALLFAGLDNDDPSRIVAGSVAAAVLAIGADLVLRGCERVAVARLR
jgi:osmoprotectant transport system permease protein